MTIQVLPLCKEDLPECFDMAFRSLHENNGPWALVFPNGFVDADRDHWVAKQIREWPAPSAAIYQFKAVNPDLPPGRQIVGMSRWNVYPTPGDLEVELDKKKSAPSPTFSPSMDAEYRVIMINMLFAAKYEIMKGQAFVHLHVMVVHPDAQKQGVGTQLMKWGVDKADELGIKGYVEASPAGKRLYEKFGFEVFRVARPEGKWKEDDRALHYYMVRQKSVPAV